MPPMKMAHNVDPKEEIFSSVGDLSEIELFNNNILVGIYIRPTKTKSGIILTDDTVEQDKFQGKMGVVLKMGPTACVPDDSGWFKNFKFEVGDWVIFRPSDGWSVAYNSHPCRIMDDVVVRGRVKYPDSIW